MRPVRQFGALRGRLLGILADVAHLLAIRLTDIGIAQIDLLAKVSADGLLTHVSGTALVRSARLEAHHVSADGRALDELE